MSIDGVYREQARRRRWERYGDPQDAPELPDELFESDDPADGLDPSVDYSDRDHCDREEAPEMRDQCRCGRIKVGGELTDSRNWNPDCPEHGTASGVVEVARADRQARGAEHGSSRLVGTGARGTMEGGTLMYLDIDDDRREDARREEYDDRLDRYGLTCEDCENRYMPGRLARCRGYHLPLCPECGGNPIDN